MHLYTLVQFQLILHCALSNFLLIMKSTKVQNPRRILLRRTMPMRVRGNWPCLAFCSCNAWCCQFSLQQGLAASFWARLNVVDNRWASWVFPCGSASITVNTNTHAHHFCYEEKWPPKCMEHYGDPARSQQRSIFRENATNFFTFIAR